MKKEDDNRPATKIGHSTYYGAEFENPELQQLILEWQEIGYSKLSGLEEQMEWAVVEVLLLEDFEVSYVSTGYVDYPSFPYDELEKAKKLLAAVRQAKEFLGGFQLAEKSEGESTRSYLAKVSDRLEVHLASRMDRTDASIAADYFLSRSVRDPPLGYED